MKVCQSVADLGVVPHQGQLQTHWYLSRSSFKPEAYCMAKPLNYSTSVHQFNEKIIVGVWNVSISTNFNEL